MALDIYVGSLTRYYARDWNPLTQKEPGEPGDPAQAWRPDPGEEALRDPEEIRPLVLEWRQGITQALKERIIDPFEWNEGADAAYFSDQLGHDSLASLRLWAAYAEHADLKRPTAYVTDLANDPAFLRSNDPEGTSAYSHLIRDVELWLPWDFAFTFRAPTPAGGKVGIGSAPALRRQLAELNTKTWRASSEATLSGWRQEGAPPEAPLEAGARFAFGVLYPLAALAEKDRLPMKLDI